MTRHGDNFYVRIGAIGGRNGHTGGFYNDKALARIVGTRGDTISRRGVVKLSPAQRKRALRKLERNKAYQQLLRVHEAAKREREVSGR